MTASSYHGREKTARKRGLPANANLSAPNLPMPNLRTPNPPVDTAGAVCYNGLITVQTAQFGERDKMSTHDLTLHQTIEGIRFYFNSLEYRTSHFHRDIEIMWVLEGGMEVQAGGRTCEVHAGEMFLVNSEQPHEIKTQGGECTLMGIQLSPDLIAEDVPEFPHIQFEKYFVNALPDPVYQGIERMLVEVMDQYLTKPPLYELYCKSQMRLFLYALLKYLPYRVLTEEQSQTQKNQNARLQRLVQFVKENYKDNIRLSDFAKREGRSLSHISHFVQDTMHQSFREYVNLVRYHEACKMMMTGQYKMLDICMECGFSDYRYFSKTFLSHTGLTPEAYGRQLTEKVGDETSYKHNIHSRERFYTPEESVQVIKKLREQYGEGQRT